MPCLEELEWVLVQLSLFLFPTLQSLFHIIRYLFLKRKQLWKRGSHCGREGEKQTPELEFKVFGRKTVPGNLLGTKWLALYMFYMYSSPPLPSPFLSFPFPFPFPFVLPFPSF
jgi:hypothetical protein